MYGLDHGGKRTWTWKLENTLGFSATNKQHTRRQTNVCMHGGRLLFGCNCAELWGRKHWFIRSVQLQSTWDECEPIIIDGRPGIYILICLLQRREQLASYYIFASHELLLSLQSPKAYRSCGFVLEYVSRSHDLPRSKRSPSFRSRTFFDRIVPERTTEGALILGGADQDRN